MPSIINLNDTTPAPPEGKIAVKWQADPPPEVWTTPRNVSAYVPGPLTRVLGACFDGTPGATVYFGMPWACTITRWRLQAIGGAATITIWKCAGGALPDAADSITPDGVSIGSGTDTDWQPLPTGLSTTALDEGDSIAFHLEDVSGATLVVFELEVQP